jgi:hypothetical protein
MAERLHIHLDVLTCRRCQRRIVQAKNYYPLLIGQQVLDI